MPEFQSPLEFTPRLWNDTTQNLLELIFQVVIEAQLAFNKKDPEQKSLPELETVVMLVQLLVCDKRGLFSHTIYLSLLSSFGKFYT